MNLHFPSRDSVTQFPAIESTEKEYWVLEGDYGGQVYLTIPKHYATQAKVAAALCIIDALEWDCNGSEGASYYRARGNIGDAVWGGMGGGQTAEGLWLHKDLLPSLKTWLQRFFSGQSGLPTAEEMYRWFFSESHPWRKHDWDGYGKSFNRRWWKKFRGHIRQAQKSLDGNLKPPNIPFGAAMSIITLGEP